MKFPGYDLFVSLNKKSYVLLEHNFFSRLFIDLICKTFDRWLSLNVFFSPKLNRTRKGDVYFFFNLNV